MEANSEKSGEIYRFLSYSYDVAKAKRLIRSGDIAYQMITIRVKEWTEHLGLHHNLVPGHMGLMHVIHMNNVDNMSHKKLQHPGIVIVDRFKSKGSLIIDGHHRLLRRYKDNIKSMPVFYIDDPEEVKKFKI